MTVLSGMQVFLEGVKAALTADAKFNGGEYSPADPPVVGLKACARVYAGEALAQSSPATSSSRVLWACHGARTEAQEQSEDQDLTMMSLRAARCGVMGMQDGDSHNRSTGMR